VSRRCQHQAAKPSVIASAAAATANSTAPCTPSSFIAASTTSATRDYIARRIAEGKSARDVTRILKRYLARHLYRVMQNATPLTT
jgi:hypothetical protein